MSKPSPMGEALVRWGIQNVSIWQIADRTMGRDYTLRIYPESAEFFKHMEQ